MCNRTNDRLRRGRRSAFTLIDLIVAVSTISILISLLLPGVQAAREAARRTQCATNLQQIGLALQMYHGLHKSFPPGIAAGIDRTTGSGDIPTDALFWSGGILPFLEQQAIYEKLTPEKDFVTGLNAEMLRIPIAVYRCPSSAAPESLTHGIDRRVPATYLGCASGTAYRETGPENRMLWDLQNGVFFVDSQVKFADIVDGASSTILVGESLVGHTAIEPDGTGTPQLVDHWAIGTPTFGGNEVSEALGSTAAPMGISLMRDTAIYPDDQELSFSSRHGGGTQFVFCDGHVTMLSESVDQKLYSSLGTRNAHEVIAATEI